MQLVCFHLLRWPLKPHLYPFFVFLTLIKQKLFNLRRFLAEKNFGKCLVLQLIHCQLVGVACYLGGIVKISHAHIICPGNWQPCTCLSLEDIIDLPIILFLYALKM